MIKQLFLKNHHEIMNCPSKDVVRIFLSRVMDSLHYFRKNNEKQTMPLVIVKLKITFKCNNVNPLFKKIYEKIEMSLNN